VSARVLIVASEAVPLAKTGGLADVISALAKHVRSAGLEATIMMPAYPSAMAAVKDLREADILDRLPGGPARLLHGSMPDTGVPVVLFKNAGFDRRTKNPYVDEQGVEFDDNAICFGALAHAVVHVCAGLTQFAKPHVVHAHDWHAGLVPVLLHLNGINDVGTIFTIHNLAFQGNFSMECASALGLPRSMVTADSFEFWGKLSFMKAGIRYANRISTVSRSYAREILTSKFGHGMDGILNERKDALVAIPNGVDVETWDPESDPLIPHRFSVSDLRGKSACKRTLQEMLSLPMDSFAPILAMGSRITHQKMADVALAALPELLVQHPRAQVIVVGCGDHRYEQGFLKLAQHFKGRVGVHIGYNEQRAHILHAGADMLLHGTRFEPFGLTPLYSMRYGTIPIASRVGGMIDSIADAGLAGAVAEHASGILFDGEEPSDLVAAVNRALEIYRNPSEWHVMQSNAMTTDFSWTNSAQMYGDVYASAVPPPFKQAFVENKARVDVELAQYVDGYCRIHKHETADLPVNGLILSSDLMEDQPRVPITTSSVLVS
jgi:starch synthase